MTGEPSVMLERLLTVSPYTYNVCISGLALISNLAEICSEQTSYHNIAQSCFEHLPRGGEGDSTRALHLKHDQYESNCRMVTISAFKIVCFYIVIVVFREVYVAYVKDQFNL